MRLEAAAHLHPSAASLLAALAAHRYAGALSEGADYSTEGRTSCNKYETKARRLLPVAGLSPRADLEDVSLVYGRQQKTKRQFLRPWTLVPKKASLHRPNLYSNLTLPSHPLPPLLSARPLMACALTCSMKPFGPHRWPQLVWGEAAVTVPTAHPERTGIEVRTDPCHGGPSVTLWTSSASTRVRDRGLLEPHSWVYHLSKTYCVPTCVNALFLLHPAGSNDVFERWRNLNTCLRVNSSTLLLLPL